MIDTLTQEDTSSSLADLLAELGNISPRRILRHPPLGMATEADLLRCLDAAHKRLCELIDGVLVEKAMGLRESLLAAFLIQLIGAFARTNKSGIVTGEAGPLRLFAGRVRMPDLAFISWERLPGRKVPTEPIPDLAPNLAVEVLSASNTPGEMALKRQDYFRAGTELVWEVDPEGRTVRVFTGPDEFIVLTERDILDGGTVLPGFTLPLHTLFAELDQQG